MVKARMIRQGNRSSSSGSDLTPKLVTIACVGAAASWFLFFFDPLFSPWYGAPQQAWRTTFSDAMGPYSLADPERIPRSQMVIVEGYVCAANRSEGWIQLGGGIRPKADRVAWGSKNADANYRFVKTVQVPESFTGELETHRLVRAEAYSKPSIKGGFYFVATRRIEVIEPARTAPEDAKAADAQKAKDATVEGGSDGH